MINVSQTIKNSCKADKNTHTEYIVINGQTIYIKGKLSATAYKDTTFIGTFNMKVLEFETENTTQFRNREFEYYKVIDGNSFKIGTFITTEIVDNDSKEMVKVTANDYALKFAIPYASSLNYDSGEVKLLDVLKECCDLAGVELENTELTNGNFIVDSNQFVNGELVGDVVCAIAGMSCDFATITENDKLRLLFKNHTESLLNMTGTTSSIETSGLNNIELLGNTTQNTTTGKNLFISSTASTTTSGMTFTKNSDGSWTLNGTNNSGSTYFLRLNDNFTLLAGTYTLSNSNSNVSNDNGAIFYDDNNNFYPRQNIVTKTFSSSVTIKPYIKWNNGVTLNNFNIYPMIEKSSSYTGFERYTGTQPSPNPSYPQDVINVTGRQEVKCVGKNLLNATSGSHTEVNLTITKNNDGSYTLNGTNGNSTYWYRLADNFTLNTGTYTLSNGNLNVNYNNGAIFYDDAGYFYPIGNIVSHTFTQSGAIIKPYIRVAANATFNNFTIYPMIEKSSTATEYEPYKEEINEINLGKNLYNYPETEVNLVKSSTRTISITTNLPLTLQAGTYTISFPDLVMANNNYNLAVQPVGVTPGGSQLTNKSRTFTITEAKTLTSLYIYLNSSDNDNATATFSKIQLEKSSLATSYSPYFTPIELCKIGTYQDKIFKNSGKNLLNIQGIVKGRLDSGVIGYESNTTNLTLNDNSFSFTTNANYRGATSDYIKVNSNLVISYANLNSEFNITCACYDSNKNWLSNATITGLGSQNYRTIAVASNTAYVRIYFYLATAGTITITNPMLVKGNTATDYEPYGNGEWYKKEVIGKVVLDGSETYYNQNGEYDTATRMLFSYRTSISPDLANRKGVCNYFVNHPSTVQNANVDVTAFNFHQLAQYSRYLYFKIDKSVLPTQDATGFKNWVANHNLIIYYQMATPTYTKLNDTLQEQLNSIRLLEGTNNVMSSVPIDLDYYGTDSEIIEDYTDLDDKRDTQPITSVSIGSSVVKGVEATLKDDNLINEYGEHWLILNDNPLAYTYDKRKKLVKAIFNKIKGFGYSSFKSKYTYKPYLTLGDTIKFKNKDGEYIDSMILRYNFNNDDCTFEAPSITSATIDYENNSGAEEMARRAEIIANQATATLTSVVSQVTTIEQEVNGETTFELTKDTQYESDKEYYTYDSEEDTYVLLQEGVDYQIGGTISGDVYEITITDNLSSQLASIKKVIETLDETLLKQTSDQFEMLFNKTGIANDYKTLKKLVDEDADYLSKVDQYIRFAGASIELGKRDNPVKLVITNDRISFMTGDTESAYISDNQLYITDSTILNKLRVGHWETKEDDLGNLNTRWVND